MLELSSAEVPFKHYNIVSCESAPKFNNKITIIMELFWMDRRCPVMFEVNPAAMDALVSLTLEHP